MKMNELTELIGRIAEYRDGTGLTVKVQVLDVKSVYGHEKLLIAPLEGSGQKWVNLPKITLTEGE
jgi:hypothetical protein